MLIEVDVSHLADFCDGYNQAVKIEYIPSQEELLVYLDGLENKDPIVKVNVKI